MKFLELFREGLAGLVAVVQLTTGEPAQYKNIIELLRQRADLFELTLPDGSKTYTRRAYSAENHIFLYYLQPAIGSDKKRILITCHGISEKLADKLVDTGEFACYADGGLYGLFDGFPDAELKGKYNWVKEGIRHFDKYKDSAEFKPIPEADIGKASSDQNHVLELFINNPPR